MIARIPVGREPEGVGMSPDGQWVLVTNESDNSMSVIDTRTLKVVKSVQVGKRPRDVAFTPDGATAYVSGEFDASLYRMPLPEGEPVERVLQLRKEARPMAVVLDSPRNRLFMSTGRGGTVAVFDLSGATRGQAGHRGAGRDTALGHRVFRGRPSALHGQRSVERRERRRHLDATRPSRRFLSAVRRGAS